MTALEEGYAVGYDSRQLKSLFPVLYIIQTRPHLKKKNSIRTLQFLKKFNGSLVQQHKIDRLMLIVNVSCKHIVVVFLGGIHHFFAKIDIKGEKCYNLMFI